MPTVVLMATTTAGNQPFSRIVDSSKTSSWSIGIPIAIVVVVAVALLAYFAAKASQAREQLAMAEQGAQQQQQQVTQIQQRLGVLDAELNRLRDPGRTTVILQSAATGKRWAVIALPRLLPVRTSASERPGGLRMPVSMRRSSW